MADKVCDLKTGECKLVDETTETVLEPEGELYKLPARNECTCECHKPGVIMMHFVACCRPSDKEE